MSARMSPSGHDVRIQGGGIPLSKRVYFTASGKTRAARHTLFVSTGTPLQWTRARLVRRKGVLK